MLILGQEHVDPPVEIHHDGELSTVGFSANGEYLLSGGKKGVQVWRMNDGKQIARIAEPSVSRLVVSQDGRWIAASTWGSKIIVWDAKTYNKVFSEHGSPANRVDFSPDSTRLVAAIYSMFTAESHVWDIATCRRAQALHHDHAMTAKYSPHGNRIATAGLSGLRIWDSNDGRLIRDISDVHATKVFWRCNDHLLVASRRGDSEVFQQIDASAGTVLAEWPSTVNRISWDIVTPKHGEFIACSAGSTITFWDTSTHTQLGCIQHTRDIHSFALSPDGRFLAIGDKDGKVTIKNLSRFTASIHLIEFSPI